MSKIIPLKALYDAVPVTPDEAAALGLPPGTKLTPTDGKLTCAFLAPAGCSVYDRRPFMCRIFGASREEALSCKLGCKPVKERLSTKDTRRLVEAYRKHMPEPIVLEV